MDQLPFERIGFRSILARLERNTANPQLSCRSVGDRSPTRPRPRFPEAIPALITKVTLNLEISSKNPGPAVLILSSIFLIGLAPAAFGQTAIQLGSPEYKPSPEHPIGWRGDWTGRFPGATPPIEWSRRVKGITTELRYQADKPTRKSTGKLGGAAKQLEYFTIKDWLVAGPFGVDDPADDINRDFLGGESAVEPSSGAKAGKSIWRPLRADVATQSRHECNEGTCGQSNVDFVYVFGTAAGVNLSLRNPIPSLNKQAGYAHTYIYSPTTGPVRLQFPFAGIAGRFWLNGKPTDLEKRNPGRTYEATLTAGWNRLLVKITVEHLHLRRLHERAD